MNRSSCLDRRMAMMFLAWTTSLLDPTPSLRAQGQLVFDNRVPLVVVAPVHGPEPEEYSRSIQGNSAMGFPSGMEVYSGELLAGGGFTAQLFAGPPGTPEEELTPLLPSTIFRTGPAAGFVQPPAQGITVPGLEENERAQIQLRVWENRNGSITDWDQVLADDLILRGQSVSFLSPPLGGIFLPPPNLVGLSSFNLRLGSSAGAVWRVNFQPPSEPVTPYWGADSGEPFGARPNSSSYGWNVDHSGQAFVRGQTSAPWPYDSFIRMSADDSSSWELSLPIGLYRIRAAVGDPLVLSASYTLRAEGQTLVDGTASAEEPWVEDERIMAVTDGRLTLTLGTNLTQIPINYIAVSEIPNKVTSLELIDTVDPWQVRLTFPRTSGVHYEIHASTNLLDWSTAGTPIILDADTMEFLDPEAGDYPQRFYRLQLSPLP